MRNELALALKECDLTQVKGLNRVKEYSWFDSENERESKNLLEATLHAVNSRQINQAVIQADELRKIMSYDRALNVISLLKEIGIEEAKSFCFYDRLGGDDNTPFMVKSSLLNWDVIPMKKSSEKVPLAFMRALTYLKLKKVKISGIAIATPAKQPMKELIEEVLLKEFKRVRKAGEKGLTGLTHAMGRVAEYTSAIYRNLPKYKDPILLIKVGQFYVEAGRWI